MMTQTTRILSSCSFAILLAACGENFDDAGDDVADEAGETGMTGQAEAGDADAGDVDGGDLHRCDGGPDGDAGDGDSHDPPRCDGGDADAGSDGDDGCGNDGGETAGGETDGGSACESTDLDLIAGQNYAAGDVTISTSEDGLVVEIAAKQPWALEMVHIYAGLDIPDSNPGSYPIHADLDHADHYAVVIPMDSIPAECGDVILVAVHTEVVDQVSLQEETAWASGDDVFEMGWGSWFEVSICC